MKRLSSVEFLLALSMLLLAVSCSSTSFTEKAVREAEALPLEERAGFYEDTVRKDRSLPVFYNLIHTYLELGEYTEAKGWLNIALANHPSAVRLYNAALYTARETEDRELALKTLEKAVRRWPGDETFTDMWLTALRETEDERAYDEALKASERWPSMQSCLNILADHSAFYQNKRKITLWDFSRLDLPRTIIEKALEESLIRTWRSLPE